MTAIATKRKKKDAPPVPPREPVMLPLAEAMERFKADFADAIAKRFAASEKAVAEFREMAAKNITYAMEWRGKDAMYAERLFQTDVYAGWKKHGAELLTVCSDAEVRKNINFKVRWKSSEILDGNNESNRSTSTITNLSDSYRLPAEQEQLKINTFILKALKTWDSLNAKLAAGETTVSEDDCRLPSWYGLFERYEDEKPNAELLAALEAIASGMGNLSLEQMGDAGVGGINDGKQRAIYLERFVGLARATLDKFKDK